MVGADALALMDFAFSCGFPLLYYSIDSCIES